MEQPEVQIFDVKAYTHAADSFPGIESTDITLIRGPLIGIRKEGEEYPSSFERAGTDEGPVTFNIQSRSWTALSALLNLPAGDVTMKARKAGAGADVIITITGAQYERAGVRASRDQKGMFNLSGKGLTHTIEDVVVV